MSVTLPESIQYGKVVGRFILAVADASDADRTPDAIPATGNIVFTPAITNSKILTPDPVTVVRTPIRCTLNALGELVDPELALGVWLIEGVYKVTYSLANVTIASHDIQVLTTHTDENPLDLTNAIPPAGPPLTPTQYAELVAMIEALPTGGGGGGAVSSVNGQTGVVVLTAAHVGALTKTQADGFYSPVGALTKAQADGFYSPVGALTKAQADGFYSPIGALTPAQANAVYATQTELDAVAQSTGISDVVFVTDLENVPPGTPVDTLIVVRAP